MSVRSRLESTCSCGLSVRRAASPPRPPRRAGRAAPRARARRAQPCGSARRAAGRRRRRRTSRPAAPRRALAARLHGTGEAVELRHAARRPRRRRRAARHLGGVRPGRRSRRRRRRRAAPGRRRRRCGCRTGRGTSRRPARRCARRGRSRAPSRGSPRSAPTRRSRAGAADDLRAAVAGALDERVDLGGVEELGERHAADARRGAAAAPSCRRASRASAPRRWTAARRAARRSPRGSARVELARHADHARRREAEHALGERGHLVERVRDDDHDGVRRAPPELAADVRDDPRVALEQVGAALTRRARPACRHDDEPGAVDRVAARGAARVRAGSGQRLRRRRAPSPRARPSSTSTSASRSQSPASPIRSAVEAPTIPQPITAATRTRLRTSRGPRCRGARTPAGRRARRRAARRGRGTPARAVRRTSARMRDCSARSAACSRSRSQFAIARARPHGGGLDRVHRGQARGLDLRLGAGGEVAAEAPDVRDLHLLHLRRLLGLVRGQRDVRGGLDLHDQERLPGHDQRAPAHLVDQLRLVGVDVRDHLRRGDLRRARGRPGTGRCTAKIASAAACTADWS